MTRHPQAAAVQAVKAEPAVQDERMLVVLAGLPGAGKTTLLRRLASGDVLHELDAEDVAHGLKSLPLPYRVLRPAVHAVHLLHVLVAALASPCRTVLTTDPLTSPLRRLYLRAVSAGTGRRLIIVIIDAEPGQAREGQRRRGRAISDRRMRRHERRYTRLRHTTAGNAVVISRAQAAQARSLVDLLHPLARADQRLRLPSAA